MYSSQKLSLIFVLQIDKLKECYSKHWALFYPNHCSICPLPFPSGNINERMVVCVYVCGQVCVNKSMYGLYGASLVAQLVRICLQRRRPQLASWVGNIPRRRGWQPTLIFLLKNPHAQGSLAACSPWGYKESDTAERLSTAQHVVYMFMLTWSQSFVNQSL